MELQGKEFLVVGGAGLIGSHTVDALLQEGVAKIRIYDNLSRGSEENLAEALDDPRVEIFPLGGEILQQDVLEAAMEGMDGVFHFAAMWLLHCEEFPRSAFRVNVEGTLNVVEAMLRRGVRRLVYSSSASVYGDAVREPMDEDHPLANTNFYGATKVASEQICRSLYHRHQGTDRAFSYAGLRYMNVYGPRQDYLGAYVSVIMKVLDRIDRGEPPLVYGDGSQAYDFIYVGDCARANVCAMRAETTDRFYNVATGRRTSILEITRRLLDLTGSDLEIQFVEEGQTFVKNRVGCPERAREEIGFDASVALEDGLKEVIAWRASHRDEVARRRAGAGGG